MQGTTLRNIRPIKNMLEFKRVLGGRGAGEERIKRNYTQHTNHEECAGQIQIVGRKRFL